ncbi:alpha/beta fold hydrolase [Williamsia sp.]|uniref:alpha/beta fold hydrolase n=1 Tax=Williamsia sp. TaxID=1872085 RepID=UPI001A1DA762|nr:alpha/beta fold hydrolase [Williamsia sp.]MBJ7288975.1 alpha/beta fold hydrolase [Williamsia sp.]
MSDAQLPLPGTALAFAPTPTGDGRRVVVSAHGLTSSRADEDANGIFDWSPVDGGDTMLVRYDARGHGESTGRPEPADYAWTTLADDLLALIDAVSPDTPVDAIGASMGTATIVWAALRRPDRFRRLVLAIPPTAWETRAAQVEGYLAAAAIAEQYGIDAFVTAMAEQPPAEILTAGGWADEPKRPSVNIDVLPSVLRGAAISDLPDTAELAELTHPTLILPWATDPGHPVSTAEVLADALAAATLEIAEDPAAIRGWGGRAAEFLRS